MVNDKNNWALISSPALRAGELNTKFYFVYRRDVFHVGSFGRYFAKSTSGNESTISAVCMLIWISDKIKSKI